MIRNNSPLATEFWNHGRVDNCPIIDFHGHMGEFRACHLPRKTPQTMLKTLDQCNVRLFIFCGTDTLLTPCLNHQLDIDVVRNHPDRFRAYFALNANALDDHDDLQRFQQNPDVFVGVKMLPSYYQRPINDDRYTPFYEYANDRKMLFLCHTWGQCKYNGIPEAEKFLNRFPDVTFIAGHSFHGDWEQAARLCNTYPNLYLELTAVLDDRGPLELLLERCGSTKILFGTDLPWFDTHHGIGTVLATDMTDDDRRNIFHRNGQKLLNNQPWFQKIWKYTERS